MTTIETTDLFRGAYLRALGFDLIEIREPAEPLTLVFRGEQAAFWNQAYDLGLAVVDPRQLHECLKQLEDEVYDRL